MTFVDFVYYILLNFIELIVCLQSVQIYLKALFWGVFDKITDSFV